MPTVLRSGDEDDGHGRPGSDAAGRSGDACATLMGTAWAAAPGSQILRCIGLQPTRTRTSYRRAFYNGVVRTGRASHERARWLSAVLIVTVIVGAATAVIRWPLPPSPPVPGIASDAPDLVDPPRPPSRQIAVSVTESGVARRVLAPVDWPAGT